MPFSIFDYHEATKHHLHRPSRSAGFMDWANQPEPFRFYRPCEVLPLDLHAPDPAGTYLDLYERNRNTPRAVTLENLSTFLKLSLGITAWKAAGPSTWALRANPSSGNLHPTEGYLILPFLEKTPGGIFHYSPYAHALERRAQFPDLLAKDWQESLGANGFLFALTSIFWREAWKYGERAYRYCQHDIGHALAAASFAANLMGWQLRFVKTAGDEDLAALLGLNQTVFESDEQEYAEVLCQVITHTPAPQWECPAHLIQSCGQLTWVGAPNRLSSDHMAWPIILEAHSAALKPHGWNLENPSLLREPLADRNSPEISAASLIRQRRSAVSYDGTTGVRSSAFFSMLEKIMPRSSTAPFDFELGPSRISPVFFIHRVEHLEPGLYLLVRNAHHLERLKALCDSRFVWKKAHPHLPFYLLTTGILEREAELISCHQSIASDSAFSLGMLADFEGPVRQASFVYRHLFWETGMIGQVLYLEAEAHGLRATGIGCFFDDLLHELMGLQDRSFQSLYHFTVGGAVEDTRLTTLEAYHHLERI